MFGKIFIKEWRENRLLLSLTGLILAALIIMGLAGRAKTSVDIAGVLLLCVLPVSALLLGSGAYSAEFRDNAWSYLFSRPIRKSTIWISKYLALLSFLAAAFLILNLAVAFLPGLKGVLKDFYAPNFFGNLAVYGLAIFLALTISYSLSILSEKSLITFAVSVLTGALLFWLHVQYIQFLRERFAFWGIFAAFGLFVGASFLFASILTLAKIDFTQQAKKLFSFVSFVLLFLALSFIAGTLIISKGNPFSKPRIELWHSSKVEGNVYLGTQADRVIRYDSKEDIVRKMPRSVSDADFELASGGGKIGFIKIDRSWTGTRRAEVWVANLDGTQEMSLAQFYGKDSAFNGWTPESNILISSDGRQAAFVAMPPRPGRERSIPVLFWMNVDGTDRMSRPLDFYRKGDVQLVAWLGSENSIVLHLVESGIHKSTERIVKLDLASGTTRSLESTSAPQDFYWRYSLTVSPDQEAMLIRHKDQAQNTGKLSILDFRTFEMKEVCESPHLLIFSLAWTPESDRIAFFKGGSIWVYSRAENKLEEAWHLPWNSQKDLGISFDWLEDGKRMAVIEGTTKDASIIILGRDFREEKKAKIPKGLLRTQWGFNIWGLDDKVLLAAEDTGVWRLDLKTDEWKKVY